MRYGFLILALYTLLFSTQPIWQTACEQWLVEYCASTCAAPVEDEDGTAEIPQCCPPFQCCYITLPGFSTPYVLELNEFFEERQQPRAKLKTLLPAYTADCFHPPELTASSL